MARKSSIINKSWEELEKYIISLGNLTRNWDSYNGMPISVSVIINTVYFINTLDKKATLCPVAVPTSTGNIQLEWETKDGSLEVVFTAKGELEGLFSSIEVEYSWGEMVTNSPFTHHIIEKLKL
jgi:hypothetical protein